ncbi:MAG: FAD-dependent oxidoreductase [Candidatus Omnitrophica bacterium]|nr:FAD-dependent oxidoreductase [Candidatus Omnitrophota bacterium]MDD5430050.1 FAD-dependent oxidoreductase [Candidatus Omnitrophota bacterium]
MMSFQVVSSRLKLRKLITVHGNITSLYLKNKYMEVKNTEIIIIGAGIAGVSAAVYAKRSGLDFVLCEEKAVGGQLLLMEKIDNYIGLGLGLKGWDLANNLDKTLSELGIPVVSGKITDSVINESASKVDVMIEGVTYEAKGCIVATGAAFEKLGVKGEAEFSGKGVSYCAVCDGFFFRDKNVAVVGGGNTAVEEAMYLSGIAKKVTLIHRRDKLRALDYLQKEMAQKDNIEVVYNSVVEEINGSRILEKISLKNVADNQRQELIIDGLFVAVGVKPNTEQFKGKLSMDEKGFIITNEEMQASSKLIWAAGDCRRRPLRQLITAASEGAIASMGAYKYLKGRYVSV